LLSLAEWISFILVTEAPPLRAHLFAFAAAALIVWSELGYGQAPNFSVAVSPTAQTLWQAGSGTYLVTIGAINGFTGTVTLSMTGLPTGATGSFSPATINGSGTTTLTLTAGVGTPLGSSTITITITGTSGALTNSTTTTATIVAPPEIQYTYDRNGRLTSVTDKTGNTAIYADVAGRRTSMGGSLARVGLPAALSSASFDAANRMTSRGGVTMTYDANGNLTNDGSQTYTWNSRDQLTAVGSASFAYDAGGRRRSRTVAGGTTGLLYDGANPIQEIVGGSPSANVLGGMAMDEVYQRTDAAGTRSLQVDGLNSTLGLLDSSGSATTQYTYEPFGGTTVSGSASGNGFQYTGREADGTGLMYYRARYYAPDQQRFIAEDPIGFDGGDTNLYSYVGNNSTGEVDPEGLSPWPTNAHHWLPQSIFRNQGIRGAISDDAFRMLVRWTSGELPSHCFEAGHAAYNKAVRKLFLKFLATEGISAANPMTSVQVVKFARILFSSANPAIQNYVKWILFRRQAFILMRLQASAYLSMLPGSLSTILNIGNMGMLMVDAVEIAEMFLPLL
jgi:RHS repeat-associated protein